MATRMQQRRGTATQWTSSNPILNAGEIGWESDTNKFKIGDGTNHWADLDYFIDQSSTVNPSFGSSITFEGSTSNEYETTLQVTDPTADRTITLPNNSGTVALTSDLSSYAPLSGATFTGAINGTSLTLSGDLTVNGSTTTINSTTLTVDDIVIELGDVANPTNSTANGGGIILKGDTNKTIVWNTSYSGAWIASENLRLVSGKAYGIGDNEVLSLTTLGSTVVNSSLTSVGTITSGTWSGSFGAVSGANLTNLTAGNLVGTIPSEVLGNSQFYLGTTSISLNRASGEQGLSGITEIVMPGSTSGTLTLEPSATAGTTTIVFPATNGTVVTTGDTGSVTSTMIADGTIVDGDINAGAAIAISKLAASTISGVSLGNSLNSLTIGTGLSGSSYNGSAAVTIAIDSTVATLTGTQTLTGKTISLSDNTVSGTIAQFNTALSDADFATVAGAETLTNKTISAASNTLTIAPTDLTGVTASAAEINILDGVTASTAEINVLDGLTSSTTELNYVDGVTSAIQTQIDSKVSLSGGTMTGALTLHAAPTQDLHAATKLYVDNVTSGINFHQAAHAATTANLSADYNNGTDGVGATLTASANGPWTTLDGHTSFTQYDRILVKDQTDAKQNGIYILSDLGSASSKWILTRASDADNNPSGEMKNGDFTLVLNGTVNAGYGFVNSSTANPIAIGTDNITYVPFNSAKTIVAGNGLQEATPGEISIDTSITQTRVANVSDTEIGYLDGVTSSIQTQLNSKAPTASPTFTGTVTVAASGIAFTDGTQTKEGVPSRTPIVQKSASYTLGALTERDSLIEVSNASATTITIPADSTLDFPIGTSVDVLQTGAGQVTIAGAVGVTVNATPGLKLRAQWSSATLFKRAANTWVVIGDLSA